MLKRLSIAALIAGLLFIVVPAAAQAPASGPVYIVQPGDALSAIAARFKVSLTDLMSANSITDANSISAGAQLTIPGLDGITGTLITEDIGYGDSLNSLSRRMQIPLALLGRLNRFTSPMELYAGLSLVYQQEETSHALTNRISLSNGESMFEASILAQTDPWTLSELNALQSTWAALPGDALYAPGNGPENGQANGLPSAFVKVKVNPLPITQGGTAEIIVQAQPGVQLSGMLVDKPLQFFSIGSDQYVALQGTYALLNPGSYPLGLVATLPDGINQSFEQSVIVKSGNYPTDPLLSVASDTIDPTTNDAETQQLDQLTAPVTPTRYWQGGFKNPTAPVFADCHPSLFGDRRNYVGQGTNDTYHTFHSGLDFCGQVGDPIYAAADGIVIFTGKLTVHGNTTIIDHGWGIYSMYCHQSEFNVQVGQQVKAGDLIGKVGATGRVTGPHLHFEIWVNGIEVNPLDWLAKTYP
jgi:murein DD-endopeptidase MepM/ murein hydrolase activator NlpD